MKKIVFLFIINIFTISLNCCEYISRNDFFKIEVSIQHLHKKMNYLFFIAKKLEKLIKRNEDFIKENKLFFNEFVEYIECLKMKNIRKIHIIAANYRFYKWLFYYYKKSKTMKKNLRHFADFAQFEEKKENLEGKLELVKSIKKRLNNVSEESKCCRKNFDDVYRCLLELENRILNLIELFSEVYNCGNNVDESLEIQVALFNKQRHSIEEFNCCLWV